jgi:hypothetical protein
MCKIMSRMNDHALQIIFTSFIPLGGNSMVRSFLLKLVPKRIIVSEFLSNSNFITPFDMARSSASIKKYPESFMDLNTMNGVL